MSNISWAVQSNLVNQVDIERMREAASELGHGFYEYVAIPFCDDYDLNHIPRNEKVVFYGSTGSIAKISNRFKGKNEWVFYTGPEGLNHFFAKSYMALYDKLALNHSGGWYQVKDFQIAVFADLFSRDGCIFARPNDGDKSFSGQVMELREFHTWCKEVELGDYPDINGNSEILVAPPTNIDSEFRCWIVNHEVVSISMYRSLGQIQRGLIYEESPIYRPLCDFAEVADRLCSPDKVYCLDIGLANNERGRLVPYVVENNCFHSSGWYQADAKAVMKAIGDLNAV